MPNEHFLRLMLTQVGLISRRCPVHNRWHPDYSWPVVSVNLREVVQGFECKELDGMDQIKDNDDHQDILARCEPRSGSRSQWSIWVNGVPARRHRWWWNSIDVGACKAMNGVTGILLKKWGGFS